jgi:hypothetical protein
MQARIALVVLTLSAGAAAQDDAAKSPAGDDFVSVRLDWQRAPGAEECVSAEALQQAVANRLGRSPFVAESSHVTVKGRVAPQERGWIAELELVSERGVRIGTRTIQTEADHCSALDESLPLVLALMIDIPQEEVRRAEEALEPKPAPAPEPRPVVKRAPPRTTPIAVPKESFAPREPWRFQAAAIGTASLGLLPEVGFGAGVTIGVEPPTFWLTELDATVWLPADTEDEGEGGGQFSLLSVGLYLCPLSLDALPLRVDLCAGQRVGRLVADGFDFDRNREQVRLIYTLGLRSRAWLSLAGPFLLGFGLGIEAPLARDKFFYTGSSGERAELFRMAPVAGTAELGLGITLP